MDDGSEDRSGCRSVVSAYPMPWEKGVSMYVIYKYRCQAVVAIARNIRQPLPISICTI